MIYFHRNQNAAKVVGCSSCSSHSLVLYKLGNLITTCSCDHHLFPILWQKFFKLYLARVQFSDDVGHFAETHGVAVKFFEQNVSLMKKMKALLVEAETFEKARITKTEDEVLSQFYKSRSR